MPIEFGDQTIESIVYERASDQNIDQKTPLVDEQEFKTSNIYIPYQIDFTERIFRKEYYNTMYVIKKIGGIHAVIAPIINWFMIIFTFNFLFHLSKVFLRKNEEAYKTDFVKFLQL